VKLPQAWATALADQRAVEESMVAEPIVTAISQPEASLQAAFVAQLRSDLTAREVPFVLIESFGLDVAVFATPNGLDRNVFFELKAFVGQRAGAVGFGNQKGLGPQVDLLYDSVAGSHHEPDVLRRLDRNIRWLLVDGTRPIGTERYALFTSEQAQVAAMGGVRPGKQNNLRIKSFVHWHSWEDACRLCVDFVVGS
jgi:hypothetical protein